jgi:hypothetical protein
MPKKSASKNNSNSNSKKQQQQQQQHNTTKKTNGIQKGGVYATEPTPAIRNFRFTKANQQYPLEGAPEFPPGFLRDDSCAIL